MTTVPAGRAFRMTIEMVVTVTGRPGYLAGTIESGSVRAGDRQYLLDGETVIRRVTCDAVEFVVMGLRRPADMPRPAG